MRLRRGAAAAAGLGLMLVVHGAAAQGQGGLPPGFVYLRDIDPTIAQDMRYASYNNFVGRPLTGYDAAECVLRRDTALALKRVQADLAANGLGLKVYDCYRPVRAVRNMWQWATDGRSGAPTKRFFPKLDKSTLFGLGYIATVSGHSTGTTVDLTMVEANRAAVAAFDPAAAYGACTDVASRRAPDDSVDMGAGFDCFDTISHTASPGLTAEQRRSRNTLLAAMGKRGFKNYFREWWHFTYGDDEGLPHYDVPIRPAH